MSLPDEWPIRRKSGGTETAQTSIYLLRLLVFHVRGGSSYWEVEQIKRCAFPEARCKYTELWTNSKGLSTFFLQITKKRNYSAGI